MSPNSQAHLGREGNIVLELLHSAQIHLGVHDEPGRVGCKGKQSTTDQCEVGEVSGWR